MGFFGPKTIDENITRVNKNVDHPTTGGEKAVAVLNGALTTTTAAAVGTAGAIAYDTVKHSTDFDNIIKQSKQVVMLDGVPHIATAKLTNVDAMEKFSNELSSKFKPKVFIDEAMKLAKENKKGAAIVAAGSLALGAAGGLNTYLTARMTHDADIGESVRKLRQLGKDGTGDDRQHIADGLTGGNWVAREQEKNASASATEKSGRA